ncbi:MAG: ABC transporter ATP-binding protein, partial [Eubacteriaceae bacterium]|nr:ABC transporter ATP-binding protein [Eubacteriaceae bacterium]
MERFTEKSDNTRLDIKIWKRIIHELAGYKKEVFLLMFFMTSVSLADSLFPLLTKTAIDDFIIPGKLEGISSLILKYIVLVLWQSWNIYIFIKIAGKIEVTLTYNIRKKVFNKIQMLSFSYFDNTPKGWIMSRLTSDIRRLGEIISWGIVDLVWGSSMMIIIAGFMLYYNLRLALIALSVIPFLALISIFFQKKILGEYREVRKINSNLTAAFSEGIAGAMTSKTLALEEENSKDFRHITTEMKASSVRAAVFSSLFLPMAISLGAVGTSMVIVLGGNEVAEGALSYGILVLFISYSAQFFEPVRELARVLAEFQQAQASAERIFSLIETEPDIKDRPEVSTLFGDIFDPHKENWPPLLGNIEFRNVSFQYQNGEKVLDGFNLSVRKGEKIALVGETGAGKSTVINLLCRFYEPSSGSIFIDGVDYRERSLEWLHSNLGYVLQSPHLFSGTVKENILYGKPECTFEEVVEAAKQVGAHDFISRLEYGYETQVGEGGGKLSTGEKQLISFARAIIGKPALFVLDEATSSIDTQTEIKIQKAINSVLLGRTSFIVAHRLSTIISSDKILV